MPNVRIEFVPIQNWGLGILGFDRLQLVFEQGGATSQDEWFVIVGVKGQTLRGALGPSGNLTLLERNS